MYSRTCHATLKDGLYLESTIHRGSMRTKYSTSIQRILLILNARDFAAESWEDFVAAEFTAEPWALVRTQGVETLNLRQ